MKLTATARQAPPASLDGLYALIRDDLAQVDTLILTLVKNEVPLIYDIAQHIIASGGKRIRPALTLAAAKACGYTGTRHIALAAAAEFLHTATLLHDDVVDESKLRRGRPTANDIFGNKPSILVGDFILGQAFQLMVADGSLRVLAILSEAAAVISKGEVMQLMTEGELKTTVEHYLQVVTAKTAVLFGAAAELGAVVMENEILAVALREFGTNIGIAFQLVDDMLDYSADQKTLGKTIGDDFAEGKITLPVILAWQAGPADEKTFWERTMHQGEQNETDFDEAVRLLTKHGALGKTLAMAGQYCDKARASLAAFPANPAKNALLDVVEFCASRTY